MEDTEQRKLFFEPKEGLSSERPSACENTVNHQVTLDDGPIIIKECVPDKKSKEDDEPPIVIS